MDRKPNASGEDRQSGRSRLTRGLVIFGGLLVAFVIYAYGFQVTQVNLEEAQSPHRQEQLFRILRALAHPDLLQYETVEITAEVPFWLPCPAQETSETASAGPTIVVEPTCAGQGEKVTVRGTGFPGRKSGNLYFIPSSEVRLNIGTFQTDGSGAFEATAELPERPSDETQHILAVTRSNVGSPTVSRNALDTWNKIVETVFLALLATTFGVLVAVPLSFLAARNLMKDVKSTLASISLSVLAIPLGAWIGINLTKMAFSASGGVPDSPWISLGVVVVCMAIAGLGARWALPAVELRRPPLAIRVARLVVLAVVSVITLFGLIFLARFMVDVGGAMAAALGLAAFLGVFIQDLGAILSLLVVVIAVVAAAGALASVAGGFGRILHERLSPVGVRFADVALGALAGAMICIVIMAVIDWLYTLLNPAVTLYWPAGIGLLLGAVLSVRVGRADTIPIGITIYTLSRTVLNVLRAIEPLIMVIVAVVWVGIGPFAGVIALSIHTVASLAKLYSEQVESILPGPLEAISATGATRLQTIIYAVVPQVIPPYISFTMYRWDINVRFSTVIGFAGGGGIGFLLIQNINLLNYRAAAAQMLAIAIVVTLLDYASSYLREKFV
jgi:ABC-type phosphate/phosphonate transport system permease subunit